MEPDDCLVECGSGQSNYTALLAPCFGNDAGRNNSLNIAATILYRGVAAINGQSVAARVSAADLVDATWLGHQPGLAAGGETATVAAGLRFQPTCAGTARVDVILEFVGDDGFFDTPVALPLVQLAVYGLGGSGGFNVTVMASEAGGLFAFQAGVGVIADIAGRSGEVEVTIAAPGAAADVARAGGAAVLLLGGVNSSILRFAAVCALGARPAPLTVALSGVAPPGIAAIPPTFIAPKPGPCFPCPPGTFKAILGPDPCVPCPSGTYRDAPGGQSQEDCSLCPNHTHVAYIGTFAAAACECDAGFEPASGIAGPCAPCASGKYRVQADAQCVPCPEGTYSPWRAAADSAVCQACPANTTAAPGASSVAQCLCRAGLYRADATLCLPCPAGSYSNAATSARESCFRCHAGAGGQLRIAVSHKAGIFTILSHPQWRPKLFSPTQYCGCDNRLSVNQPCA